MPDQKTPKTTDELIQDLGTTMVAGFQSMGERFAKIELRQDDFEMWRAKTSERVRGNAATASSENLSQAAALASEMTAREALAKELSAVKSQNAAQLVILGRLDSIADKPVVKRLAWLVVAMITGWLTLHMIPPQPAPQPQPAVTQQVK